MICYVVKEKKFGLGSKSPEEDRDSGDGNNRLVSFFFFSSDMYFPRSLVPER